MGVYMPTISSPRQGTSDNGLALRLLVQHAYTQDTAPDKSRAPPHADMLACAPEKLPEPANNIIAECPMPLANADRRRACGAHALARCVPCVYMYVVACVYVVGHS